MLHSVKYSEKFHVRELFSRHIGLNRQEVQTTQWKVRIFSFSYSGKMTVTFHILEHHAKVGIKSSSPPCLACNKNM